MFQTKLFTGLVSLMLLSGCPLHTNITQAEGVHSMQQGPPLGSNWVPIYNYGYSSKQINDGILITELSSSANNPARAAGMQIDDLITSINGKKLSNDEQCRLRWNSYGESVHYTANRHGRMVEYNVMPKFIVYAPPTTRKILELLKCGKRKISIAVVVVDIKDNTTKVFNTNQQSWEESTKYVEQGIYENYLLRMFIHDTNFSLVDRLLVDKTLEEYKINMTGLISKEKRVKIGEMTGATHFFATTLVFYSKGNSCEKYRNSRLIDLESGQVVAVDAETSDCP